jgi:hypothetical protein
MFYPRFIVLMATEVRDQLLLWFQVLASRLPLELRVSLLY